MSDEEHSFRGVFAPKYKKKILFTGKELKDRIDFLEKELESIKNKICDDCKQQLIGGVING